MSVPATSWAIEQGRRLKLSVSERMLLIAIAERANGIGICWPSQETLAVDTGLTARHVRHLAPRLERRGLIRIEASGRSLRYHMVRPNGADHSLQDAIIPEVSSGISREIPEASSGVAYPVTAIPEASSGQIPETSSGIASQNVGFHHQYRKPVPVIPEASSAEPKKEPRKKEERKKEHSPNPSQGEGPCVCSPFDDFWVLYPRKVGRTTAEAAFAAAINRGTPAETILAGLQAQTFADDRRFVPHPTRWLREGRWLDEVDNFDPVLRAAGLRPEDFLDAPPGGLLQ